MNLNNREIATGIILLSFLIFAIYKSTDKKSLFSSFGLVVKSLFEKHIFITIVLLIFYIYFEIKFLTYIGFFEPSLLKESIIWSFGAFVLIVKHAKITEDDNFSEKLVLDNLKFIVVFEFICNMYTFNLFIELILVFCVTMLILLKTVGEYQEKNEDTLRLLKVIDFLLNVFGLVIIVFTINQLVNNYNNINIVNSLKSFFLPLMLILLYLPFYYIVILYSKYEMIFVSVQFFVKDKNLSNHLKRKIFTYGFLNYSRLKIIHNNLYQFQKDNTISEIDESFERFIFNQ
ncbi:hypothetical protein [Arcobacter sp.]|uniref:hypothetical protein n=1 Tax=Arcobacter sp. TaxID=1872629 RepID=UPI003D140028